MARDVSSDVLLGLAVAIALGASLGVLLMRDAYQKLHFVTPAALVAPVLVALAVLVQTGLDENTGETVSRAALEQVDATRTRPSCPVP